MAEPQTTDDAKAAHEAQERQRTAQKWIAELGVSEKAQQKWLTRARKIQKRYKKDETADDAKRQYSMLWANTQTLLPAMFSRPPQPVVTRRFKDSDPVGRVTSEVLERALTYSVDKQDMESTLRTCVLDFALISRGVAWERYVPTYGSEIVPKIPVVQITDDAGTRYRDDDGKEYGEDGEVKEEAGEFFVEGEAFKPVVYEESVTDYVNWSDFGHGVARTWGEVPYVWRRVYMCREELIDRFGEEIGAKIVLDWGRTARGSDPDQDQMVKKASIYELWDKASRKAYWISKSYSASVLDERDDPLGLDGFFPCPRPLYGTLANDGLMPSPDYVFYQDQAEEVDDLTAKIADLQDSLKVIGLYAGDQKAVIPDLVNAKNGTLIPVPAWQTLKEGGGVSAKVEWWPIEQVIKVLEACIRLRSQIIEDIYQITGVADIMRGASDPRETAAAQGMKARWGALRVRDRQTEIARFARDIIRIKGEVIAEHFSTDTLAKMTGIDLPTKADKDQAQAQIEQMQVVAKAQMQQAAQMGHNGGPPMPPEPPRELTEILSKPSWEDVQALLRDNATRQFRIDIETDSTIEPDEIEEKQQTVELITAMGAFIAQWGPVVQAQPAMAPFVGELMKFAFRKFRAGRSLEDVLETALNQLTAQPPQAQQPPQKAPTGPTPEELMLEKQKIDNDRLKIQGDQAYDAADIALKQGDQHLKIVALTRDPQPQVQA